VTENSSVATFTRDAIRTVAETFSEFRVPGDVSYYCLKHEVQSEKYHGIHIEQLRSLAEITTGGQFREMAATLESDFTPKPDCPIGLSLVHCSDLHCESQR
jgi:hypothetical protein